MRKLAFGLVFLLPCLAAVAIGQKADGGWATYVSNEGRYSVLFPGRPATTAQESPTADGTALKQYLAYVESADKLYMVAYFDVGTAEWPFDKARDSMVSKVDGTLVSEHDVKLAGNPGRELKVNGKSGGADIFLVIRFFKVGQRVFLLQYITDKTANTDVPPEATRFFESFKVTQ